MNQLIQKLKYSYAGQNEVHSLPPPLKKSLHLISDFFANSSTNKLCLVFPAKEFAAQWLSIPAVLSLIKNDYSRFGEEIFNSYREYRKGDKLILNNLVIVEWVGINQNGVTFKTKGIKESSGAEITIRFSDVIMLQKAPPSRKVLSSLKSVKEALPSKSITATERILSIDSCGNKEFIRSKICLVSKYKSYENSIDNVLMNNQELPEYFEAGKIDEGGISSINSPLLLSKNLSNLYLYLVANPISKIIIDGFSVIQERETDFSDIDVKNIPTILITDLSEIESFEFIGNYGFEFYNFTKENLILDYHSENSPFHIFNKKGKKYIQFNLIKEICNDTDLEIIIQKIHSLEKDDSNNDLITLKVYLIQLTNLISRICHNPSANEIASFKHRLNTIDELFQKCKRWLGDSNRAFEECIKLLESVIKRFSFRPTEKFVRLKSLMNQHNYDYIICPTEGEVLALKTSLQLSKEAQIISVANVNDNLLTNKSVSAIITGWPKSSNINRILSSFLFSELTVLFYQFENNYFNSLQRKNRKYNENIKPTINNKGIRAETGLENQNGFADFYIAEDATETSLENSIDILSLEIKLDNAQYAKYISKGNLIDNIKAKRVDFENSLFIYSSESHKFLVINELIEKKNRKATICQKKIDAFNPGDVIVLINTDRDILADLVEKNTNKRDFDSVKQWTDLWKNLLKEYFIAIGSDFKILVDDLRKKDCMKHEVTIRTWLQDENRIGPDDDSDLISIAMMTNSNLLNDNIQKVRESIRKMTGWRMKASDFISDKIKSRIHEFADTANINKRMLIEGLGSANILKVIEVSNSWENIDTRFVNKLLQKENV